MSLGDLFQALKNDEAPANAVAVTFDDGYFDNLVYAKPLLEKYEVPTTVFVCTGYLEYQREFWWDEVERIFLTAGDLPERILVPCSGSQPRITQLGERGRYGSQDAEAHRKWNVQMQSNPTRRHEAYRACHGILKDLTPRLLNLALDSLRKQTGQPTAPRPSHRPMRWEEVKELATDGLIEIGGHTRWHTRLPSLSPLDQAEEIRSGRQDLIERTEIVPRAFPTLTAPINRIPSLRFNPLGLHLHVAWRAG